MLGRFTGVCAGKGAFGGLKVFVEARKSTVFDWLCPVLEVGLELTELDGGLIEVSF
jgi:hypothetical protein